MKRKGAKLTSTREGRAKGRGVGESLRAAEFEEHDAAIDDFIRFLGMES